MTPEARRIVRPATEEERRRHAELRQQVEQDRPDLEAWARATATAHRELVAVGTEFSAEEAPVIAAIDAYAATHSLPDRGAVVRKALSKLLDVDIVR